MWQGALACFNIKGEDTPAFLYWSRLLQDACTTCALFTAQATPTPWSCQDSKYTEMVPGFGKNIWLVILYRATPPWSVTSTRKHSGIKNIITGAYDSSPSYYPVAPVKLTHNSVCTPRVANQVNINSLGSLQLPSLHFQLKLKFQNCVSTENLSESLQIFFFFKYRILLSLRKVGPCQTDKRIYLLCATFVSRVTFFRFGYFFKV